MVCYDFSKKYLTLALSTAMLSSPLYAMQEGEYQEWKDLNKVLITLVYHPVLDDPQNIKFMPTLNQFSGDKLSTIYVKHIHPPKKTQEIRNLLGTLEEIEKL